MLRILFFSVWAFFLAGCARHHHDAFHDPELPEPFKPSKTNLSVNANSPTAPYQNLDWRI
jgi:hypothetical protein